MILDDAPLPQSNGKLQITKNYLSTANGGLLLHLLRPAMMKSNGVLLQIVSLATACSAFTTLITFDVDGTLVSSSPGWECGAHGRSFVHAVDSILLGTESDPSKRITGKTIPDLLHGAEFHGSTDGLILLRLARKALGSSFDGQRAAAKVDDMMNEMYQFVSQCSDNEVATGITPLPGVIQTLESLASDHVNNGVACGLVTGNVEGIARRKMNALGIYDAGAFTSLQQPQGQREWEGTEHIRFLGGFGSDYCSGDIDNPERNYLDRGEQIAICVNRCLQLSTSKEHSLQRIIHVGDAPADILAAKSYVDHPAKPEGLCVGVVGVATGSYSVDEIQSLCGETIPGVWEPNILTEGQGVGNKDDFFRACGLL